MYKHWYLGGWSCRSFWFSVIGMWRREESLIRKICTAFQHTMAVFLYCCPDRPSCLGHLKTYTPSQRGNYHHSMFHNPTAVVNLFHVGKQYLTFCKAEAAVTRNLIGRKFISNVKHSDARNSLPILDVIRSSDKRHNASKYCKWTLRQTTGVCYTRIYLLERHLTFRRNIDTRRQWSVGNPGWNEWLSWEMVINDHCLGSVLKTLAGQLGQSKQH